MNSFLPYYNFKFIIKLKMTAMIDQNVYYEIETLKTEVSQLKKYMMESL